MKTKLLMLFFLPAIIYSCTKTAEHSSAYPDLYSEGIANAASGNADSTMQYEPGLVTAAEWNDLSNWQFWRNLMTTAEFDSMPAYWQFYNTNRISVSIIGTNGQPITDALIKLKKNGTVIFTARTDNFGKAELWPNLFQNEPVADYKALAIDVNNGAVVYNNVVPFEQGMNKIVTPVTAESKNINIAFVVDATSSMGDELEFLKSDLLDVISAARADNPNASFSTGCVFYRDEGDSYLTKSSGFTTNINTTINFIKDQSADGGGDFPEAVHAALNKAINDLQWQASAKTRILFLVLDAPPHYDPDVISSLQNSIIKAAEKGIKIIPVTASGIDKQTEFCMRFFAISTNGTYVFITNDSGIGNDHLQASVGDYEVEYLNNLMVRLIDKYAK